MKYKITIVEQESGKIVVNDEHCNTIIGAISNDVGIRSVSYISANAKVVAVIANVIIENIERLKRENDGLDVLMKIMEGLKNER